MEEEEEAEHLQKSGPNQVPVPVPAPAPAPPIQPVKKTTDHYQGNYFYKLSF
jgi:hypothetical protein